MSEEGPSGQKNSKVCKSIQESVVQGAAWRNKKNDSVHTELKRYSLKSLNALPQSTKQAPFPAASTQTHNFTQFKNGMLDSGLHFFNED